MLWLWLTLTVVGVGLVCVLFWWVGRRAETRAAAQQVFHAQRPQLEVQFFAAASASGKPRGLRWKACEWELAVEFAREKATGSLAALVGVTIQFEAIPGSDMEGLPAVGNLRIASAVFFFHHGQWHTTGKALFNLNPDEALRHFQNLYDRLPA
jgi:hypothetical protein